MNTKIWKTIAFLLDHRSKNVKSDEMWYGRSFYLPKILIKRKPLALAMGMNFYFP